MDFSKLIKRRYSVRAYKSDPIPEKTLQKVLDAARLAPTAANKQAFQLLVISTTNRADELRRIYSPEWFTEAPLVICVCGIPEENWVRKDQRNYVDVDVAIVMDHLILAATNLGLGTCWIGAFDPDEATKVLSLPANVEPIAFTPLGYPADQPKPKIRKSLTELVRYDNW